MAEDTTPDEGDKTEGERCDVCLRIRITSEELKPHEGKTITEIEAVIGKRCWSPGSGPCVSLGWARVRKLENLIRSAIDDRSRPGPHDG